MYAQFEANKKKDSLLKFVIFVGNFLSKFQQLSRAYARKNA